MNNQGCRYNRPNGHAWVEGSVWVLEDHLHATPGPAQICPFDIEQINIVKEDFAICGLV
jgi:hypothetical protein